MLTAELRQSGVRVQAIQVQRVALSDSDYASIFLRTRTYTRGPRRRDAQNVSSVLAKDRGQTSCQELRGLY